MNDCFRPSVVGIAMQLVYNFTVSPKTKDCDLENIMYPQKCLGKILLEYVARMLPNSKNWCLDVIKLFKNTEALDYAIIVT